MGSDGIKYSSARPNQYTELIIPLLSVTIQKNAKSKVITLIYRLIESENIKIKREFQLTQFNNYKDKTEDKFLNLNVRTLML